MEAVEQYFHVGPCSTVYISTFAKKKFDTFFSISLFGSSSNKVLYCITFLSGLRPPGYIMGYVTGDTSVKLVWEVTSPSNKTVFEIRWKNGDNESSMVVSGATGTVTIRDLRVYTKYFFRVRKGFMNGTWGGFTKYRTIWTPEGGKYTITCQARVTSYRIERRSRID